jgi:hypothetical protein
MLSRFDLEAGDFMRSAQRVEIQVLGYAIEQRHEFGGDGSVQSTRYEVRCPRTGSILGQLQSLRMAKRFVVMHELRDFTARKKNERVGAEFRAV